MTHEFACFEDKCFPSIVWTMSSTTYNDTKQKANGALLDVEKGSICRYICISRAQRIGLRSTSIGEQSEAIVQLPALINQYPFPILINNAFLKLAEVFRTGYVNWELNYLPILHMFKE